LIERTCSPLSAVVAAVGRIRKGASANGRAINADAQGWEETPSIGPLPSLMPALALSDKRVVRGSRHDVARPARGDEKALAAEPDHGGRRDKKNRIHSTR
jgi:hypothetical protein